MDAETNSSGEKRGKVSPILGLPVDDAPVERAAAQPDEADPKVTLELSVVIPARNEEQNLLACLQSLLAQDEEVFRLGRDWELIVVDDDSADRTRALALEAGGGRDGYRVMAAPVLEERGAKRVFTGKNNACWAGAGESHGRWLLFTDADTVHVAGDLVRALHEARKHEVSLLSYSPRQIVTGLWQRTLMPLIFSELATVYPPEQVNDPAKRLAAANGQFLMVERGAYFAVGGHKAVGRSVLEDVNLAWNVKRAYAKSGRGGIRLRYAPDALQTRMYRGFTDMVEGWTKNLALLFPHALGLAAWRALDIVLLLLPVTLWMFPYLVMWQQLAIVLLWLRTLFRFYRRVARSHFGLVNCALSVLALPMFIVLLLRSWMKHRLFHQVEWKGRQYNVGG